MEKTIEDPIYSQSYKQEQKVKQFREYIADHDVVLSIVKFLVSIKNAKETPENPLKALTDYYGEYRDPSWNEFEELKKKVNEIQIENEQYQQQIQNLIQQIQKAKEDKAKKEEEERLKELEEQNKKTSKKPGKK